MSKHRLAFVFFALLVQVTALAGSVNAQGITGSIKGTVSATAGDPSARPELLAGARLSLVNKDLKGEPLKTVTDATGSFAFLDLPAASYTLTAEADGFPGVTHEIRLTTGAALVVEVVLTATVTESVTVRSEEGLLSTSETTTSNIVRSETLTTMPLRAENYQSASLLTPGVVRSVDGVDHIKGTGAGQSAYTVNGVDVTDPINGNLVFDIPIEAAGSVQIEENPYSPEFGRFRGGVTNLETKTGGDKFKVQAARLFPTLRNVFSGKVDSFRPRFTFSGPLIRQRLYFVQSFEYRFSRTRVPSLQPPRDDSTLEGVNSFTQLDLTVNKSNRLKFVTAFFPQRVRFVGLDTFNPQPTTPSTKQRGELFSVSEQAIFHDQSFLTSLVSYKRLEFDVFPQGALPLTVVPDENSGNYFADTRRSSRRLQWQEIYNVRSLTMNGQHSVKFGGEFDHTTLSGTFTDKPILIRRSDLTLSQRVDFTSPPTVRRSLNEVDAFVQDRWVVNKQFTIDGGLRFDRDGITHRNTLVPRFALMLRPLKDDRTIIRAGIGLFYDRTPASLSYFTAGNGTGTLAHFPERTVTTYALDGITVTDGPRHFVNVSSPLRTARSVRWSLQLDRGLTKNLTGRIGYLQRSTRDAAIIQPLPDNSGSGQMLLASAGRASYRELQLLAIYDHGRFHNWNVAYVWSRARGDLNTTDNFLGDFPAFVVRPNQYGPLPFDAPHHLLAYGEIKAPFALTITPSLDIRSGFPYSIVDDRLDFIGARNQARFPMYLSLDVQILKGFKIPHFDKRVRAGVAVFNVTHHFNPRDVQNNTGSLNLGNFYNSLGTSVRGKFEMDF